MLYDKAGRFVEIRTGAGRPTVRSLKVIFFSPAEQEGKEMVLLQSTVNNGLTYAVLKDGAGRLLLLRDYIRH